MFTRRFQVSLLQCLIVYFSAWNVATAQMGSGHATPPPPPPGAKSAKCSGRQVPQLEDVTAQAGIAFKHTSDPDPSDTSSNP